MLKTAFNDNWIFYKEGAEGSAVSVALPHDAMLSEPRSGDSAGRHNISWFHGGDYVYEKTFFVPDENKDKKTVFEFEGVYHNAEIYINGEKAAFRPYGYTNFYIDATPYLKSGHENTIKVIAANSDQPNSRWYTGSGIYRPVQMYILPKKHIEINGVKIMTLDYAIPKIKVSVKTICAGQISVEILDDGKVIGKASTHTSGTAAEKVQIQLDGAELWRPENPKLYTCRVTFGGDVREERFGIRTVECSAKSGFLLNGERVILRGACIHHDNGLLGAVAHPFAERRKIKLLQKNGYNAVRSAHNPCSKALLDACDELGMLVMDEYADMWYIRKTKYDYAGHLEKWWKHDLADMSDKDFNHPSVIMYSIGNEVAETGQERGIALADEMTQYLKKLDNRPVTCGVNIFFNYLYSMGFGVYTDKKSDKAAKNKKPKAVGSEFFNKLAGKLGDKTMKIGATLRGSDRKSRGAFAKLDVAGYNYGILRYKKDLKKYPDRVIVGSETFCKDAYRFYETAKANPALIGDFVWAGMDYLGEAGIGSWVYEDHCDDFSHGPGWLTAGSGRLDITGKPTAEAAYTRVVFDKQSIALAALPASHYKKEHSPSAWKMSGALESWSYGGFEGNKTPVKIYTKAYKGALFLDGVKLAEKKRNKKNAVIRFNIRYNPGHLTAVTYDKNGAELDRISLQTAGKETVLTAAPEDKEIGADGLAYVRLKFTDNRGEVKPLIKGEIKVTVQNGTLLGFGNACPYNPKGYLSDTAETYYGEALAIIKPDGKNALRVAAESKYGNTETQIQVF